MKNSKVFWPRSLSLNSANLFVYFLLSLFKDEGRIGTPDGIDFLIYSLFLGAEQMNQYSYFATAPE